MSSTRVRFSRVSRKRSSVSRLRSLYLEMPAASSKNTRSSSGFASTIREIVFWPIIAYALPPRPVPKNRSATSRRRTAVLLMK